MSDTGDMLVFLTVVFSGISFVALAADSSPRKPIFAFFLSCAALTSLSSLLFGWKIETGWSGLRGLSFVVFALLLVVAMGIHAYRGFRMKG